MVTLRPGETAADGDARRYLEAAADFERVAEPADARAAFDAAVQRWPWESVAWLGRGTAEYRLGNLPGAARDFSEALKRDGAQTAARNNLAQTYIDLRCAPRAQVLLGTVDTGSLAPGMRDAVLDTLRGAEAAKSDHSGCDSIP